MEKELTKRLAFLLVYFVRGFMDEKNKNIFESLIGQVASQKLKDRKQKKEVKRAADKKIEEQIDVNAVADVNLEKSKIKNKAGLVSKLFNKSKINFDVRKVTRIVADKLIAQKLFKNKNEKGNQTSGVKKSQKHQKKIERKEKIKIRSR